MSKLIPMKQEQIVSYFFVGFFLFVLYQLILIFAPFFAALSWALVLAFAFYPLYQKIGNLPRMNPVLAALSATAIVVLIVVLPAAMILVSLTKEAIELYYQVSSYLRSGDLERLVEQLSQLATTDWAQQLLTMWNPLQRDVSEFVLQGAKGIGNFAAIQLASFTKNLFFWSLNLFLIAFLLFFFFRDGKAIYEFIYQMIPKI